MAKTIEALATTYIDSMPPRSKVNYPDLVEVVLQRSAEQNAAESAHLGTNGVSASSWTALDRQYANVVVHQVVAARNDLTVERGRGICKH